VYTYNHKTNIENKVFLACGGGKIYFSYNMKKEFTTPYCAVSDATFSLCRNSR
jgi:hypothetical protein